MNHTVHPTPLPTVAVLAHQPADPVTVPLARAPALLGPSRSAIYRAAAEGKVKLLKLGATTLVDMASARAWLASLPAAELRGTSRAA